MADRSLHCDLDGLSHTVVRKDIDLASAFCFGGDHAFLSIIFLFELQSYGIGIACLFADAIVLTR